MFKIQINSIEEIRDYLLLEFSLVSKKNGLSPKEALYLKGMEVPSKVPDLWKAFDVESHCSLISKSDVLQASPKLCIPATYERATEDLNSGGAHDE